MDIDAFDYELPRSLIAQRPPAGRSDGRLLEMDRRGALRDLRFTDLPRRLRRGDLLVFNDTRVIPARCFGERPTGGKVEMLLERVLDARTALVQLGAGARVAPGFSFGVGGARCEVVGVEDGLFRVRIDTGALELFHAHGRIPLPPYIRRAADSADRERYQTVFAREPGAVAAPTAGLHFDAALLRALRARGVAHATLTLHVGAGTFAPIRARRVEQHRMHGERFRVDAALCEAVRAARRRGRVVAVGTTVARALESAATDDGDVAPRDAETDLFIRPGYRFRVVDMLITNFHLPKSSLLVMVSAFAGREAVLNAYRHAVDSGYRFFSYGDATLLERR